MFAQLVGNLLVRHRINRAIVPEAGAVALAEKNKYDVIGTNLRRDFKMLVNDVPVRVEIPATLMLVKDGKRYIGQIGAPDANPVAGAVRQQLLDLRYTYGVHGVVRLEPGKGKIQRLDFIQPFRVPVWIWMLIGSGIGAVIESRLQLANFLLRAFSQSFFS